MRRQSQGHYWGRHNEMLSTKAIQITFKAPKTVIYWNLELTQKLATKREWS